MMNGSEWVNNSMPAYYEDYAYDENENKHLNKFKQVCKKVYYLEFPNKKYTFTN